MQTSIKFPDQHFVTFREYGPINEKYMMGFLIPDGTDAAARKRKETGINWGDNNIPHQTLKNEPQDGFKIMTKVSRGGSWNGQQDKWRVLDPRGFVLEIPAGNLEQILALTTIVEGVIQGKCLWGREGAVNMLVPVNSEIYTQGMANTVAVKAPTIGIKNANIGDTVTFQDGGQRVYMGKLYLIHSVQDQWVPSEKPLHIFGTDGFVGYANPKIIAIEPAASPMTQDEAVAHINNKLLGAAYCSVHTYGKHYYPKAVSAYPHVAIAYHRDDQRPDFKPASNKRIFVEVPSGAIYRNVQDYGSNRTMYDAFTKSGYGTYTIKDINQPEKSEYGGSGWSARVQQVDLDRGKFFTMRREFIVTEGHFSSTL